MSDAAVDPSGVVRLYAVARALTGSQNAEEVAQAVFTAAVADLGAISVGLWLVSAGRIRFVGGAGLDERMPERILDFDLGADLPAAVVVGSGRPVIYRSAEERDRRWPALVGIPTVAEAAAVLPLEVHGRVFGCLHIGFADAEATDRFGLGFMTGLADLCAAGLDRTQMHDAERDRQAFLLDAATAVARAESFSEVLTELATVAVPRLADLCLIDVEEAGGRIRRAAAVHWDPAVSELVAELADRYAPDPTGPHPASVVMTTRRSIWAADMPDEFLISTTRDERHLQLVRALQFTSFMCVPLLAGNEALGVMTLVSAGSGRHFDGSDLALAEELASRAAAVVAMARREEQQHELAHVLQQLLLPDRLPAVPGLEIAARYLTASARAEAGGDFFDVVRLPSGRLGLAIGDVEGHDAVAAATMGQLRSATRALAGQLREPAQLLDALRWSWELLGFSRMATAIVGRIDPEGGEVVLSSAGHVPPILVTAEGRAALAPLDNAPPLGAPASAAVEQRFSVAPGDTLFFYTDGLVEERGGSIDDQLQSLVATLEGPPASLEELCDRAITVHAPPGRRSDDVAVLAIRRGV